MLSALGGAALAAPFFHKPLWAQAACGVVSSPALTEGPYFVDEDMNRSDIRTDTTTGAVQPGMPLSLGINISQLVSCTAIPMTGAYVDIWHCNASGVYSDVAAQSSQPRNFLRGWQATNRQGTVYFYTVYPGWYQGRAVHIHVKIRTFNGPNQTYEFTSQFFFDESLTDQVYQADPYKSRGERDTRNPTDGIYSGASSLPGVTSNSGSQLLLAARNKGSWIEADAKLILDMSLGSSPSQVPGGGGGPGGGPGGGTPPPGGFPPGGPGGNPPPTP